MTLPVMNANWKKQETISRLKKFHSIMQNALNLSVASNGPMFEWIVPREETSKARYVADKYLLPYLNVSKVCNENENSCSHKLKDSISGIEVTQNFDYILADGTMIHLGSDFLQFYPSDDDLFTGGVSKFVLGIDINGSAKPNQLGKDIFCLLFYTINNSAVSDPTFGFTDRQTLKDACLYSGLTCYGLIMADGWEISDDYPR